MSQQMRRWAAPVRRVTGNVWAGLGTVRDSEIIRGPSFPDPASAEIEEDDATGGYYVFPFAADGEACGDWWFETLEQAKDFGEFAYEIAVADWKEVTAVPEKS